MRILLIGEQSMVTYFGTMTGTGTGTGTAYAATCVPFVSNFPAPAVDIFDDRYNPAMWRKWFHEFLLEKIPARVAHLSEVVSGATMFVARRARARPLFAREWKLKSWIQKLRSVA